MSGALSSGLALVSPLFFIPLIYLLRRWRVGGWLALLLALGGAFLVLRFPPAGNITLLGRSLLTDALWTDTLALMLLALAGLFALSLAVPQGWTFFPMGLVVVAILGLATAIMHLGFAALLIEIAMLLTVFVVQGGRLGSVRAAQRFLVMFTLAVPLFLLFAHQLDQFHGTANTPAIAIQLALLAAGGFALWMGVTPLHGWISAIAREAQPGIAAFVFIVFPTATVMLMLRLRTATPWLESAPHAQEVLLWGGAVSVLFGGVFAAAQRSFSPLMGYATIFDLGTLVMVFGLPNEIGISILLFGLMGRTVALVLLGISTALLHNAASTDSFAAMRGLAQRLPIATVGLMVGAATLAGAPLTAGFITRWLAIQSLATIDARLPWVVVLGSIGVTVGYLHGLQTLIAKPASGAPAPPPRNRLAIGLTVGLVAVSLWLGLFPHTVLSLVQLLAHNLI